MTTTNVEFSYKELLKQSQNALVKDSSKEQKKSRSNSNVETFPELLDVLGKWTLKHLPSVTIRVTKFAQLDKRSLSALYEIELASFNGEELPAGTPALVGMFQACDDEKKAEAVKYCLTLANIIEMLELNEKALDSATYLLDLFDRMIEVAVKNGETKGYMNTQMFDTWLKAVRRYYRKPSSK